MLLVARNVGKNEPGMLIGLAGLVLSSLTENDKDWGRNCADDAPVIGVPCACARCTPASSAQFGPHFGLIGVRRGQKPKKSNQSGFEHGSLHGVTIFSATSHACHAVQVLPTLVFADGRSCSVGFGHSCCDVAPGAFQSLAPVSMSGAQVNVGRPKLMMIYEL